MTQALMTAELLAKYLRKGPEGSDQWLRLYERERQALLRDYRVLTQMILWLADHPNLAGHMLYALRAAPGLLSHFIGVAGGVQALWPFRSSPLFAREGPQ